MTEELDKHRICNEAKTVFIANISHELRTPLNGILGMTSIAMEEDDSDRIHDSLKLIHRSGELLLHILTELLTYSKNTLNRSKLEKSNFQILEIVYQVQSIFNKLAHDQRVNFKILIKPNLFRKLILYGDSNRIIQIMMNLVSNSLKFTPSLEVDFRKVYVLNDPSSTHLLHHHPTRNHTHPQTKNPGPQHSTTTPLPGSKLQPQPDNRKKDYFSSRKITNIEEEPDDLEKDVDKYLSSSNDDDTMSIVTLSTSQYETKIFESQFKAKPLPQVPVDASPTASLSDQGLKSSDEEQGLKSSDDDTVHEKQVVNSSSSNDSTTVAVARPRYNMMPQAKDFKSFPTFDKKPVYDSNMSNNEVVKNNKAYRIRNMYQPKVWVIQMEVTDTGPGIEPAMQDKVFEPFVQGDQTLSRSYGGTGLG
ncbi:Histidine protein kinase SLN1 [Candida viswanathii]|uniref:histidine kinase n=1 Tax=Candida viswanathii TaxID=5486 RepID=A0A367YND2_9ASCO|nr:Histidine protein kinase SLN1 [Candida viswanathii]